MVHQFERRGQARTEGNLQAHPRPTDHADRTLSPIRYELEQYQPWHCRRLLDAKPGITGLWQVTGRSRTTFNEMVRLDLRYARTCSLWTDVKILLATPAAVISGKGAC